MRSWTLVIDHLGRPILMNAMFAATHHQRHKLKLPWKEAGTMLAREAKIPQLAACHITVQGRYPNRVLPDTDGVAPSLKAVLDGIVDAGVLPKDTPEYVHSVKYLAPAVVPGKPPALLVKIEETDP